MKAVRRAIAAGIALTLGFVASAEAQALRIRASTADARAAAAAITRYRAANGLGPVRVDALLNRAAEQQARAVAQTGVLSHGDFAGRMNAFGAPVAAAENLAMGSRTVAEAIAQWRASPGHNASMLGRNYTRIGLARADSGHRYWALVLAR